MHQICADFYWKPEEEEAGWLARFPWGPALHGDCNPQLISESKLTSYHSASMLAFGHAGAPPLCMWLNMVCPAQPPPSVPWHAVLWLWSCWSLQLGFSHSTGTHSLSCGHPTEGNTDVQDHLGESNGLQLTSCTCRLRSSECGLCPHHMSVLSSGKQKVQALRSSAVEGRISTVCIWPPDSW